MSKTFNSPRGIFPDSTLGVLEFYNGDTDVLDTIYYDRSLTIPASNPLSIDANGYHLQVWGNKYYKIKQYSRLDGTTGIFPDDFVYVREWFEDLSDLNTIRSSILFVDTMAQLKSLVPINGDKIILLGYYSIGDARVRTLVFDSTSTDTPNDGNRVRPNGYGTGLWIEDSSTFVDARDFGCIHPTLTTNSNIAQAVSYCSSENIELKFPAGVYNVSGGSISFDCPVSVDSGAFFNVVGIDIFNFIPNGEFKLPSGVQFGTSHYFILDLTYSNYVLPEGASLEWWQAISLQHFKRAVERCGNSGLAIRGIVNIPDDGGAYSVSINRLVFHKSSSLDIDASVGTFELDVYNVEIIGRQDEKGIFTGNYSTSIFLKCDAKSSWFETGSYTQDDIVSCLDASKVLYVDNNIQATHDVDFGKVAQAGGCIDVQGSSTTLTLSVYGYGKDLISISGSSARVIGCYDAESFKLDTANEVIGFIDSCNLSSEIADFKGSSTIANITGGSWRVANWYCGGSVSVDSLNASNCKFTTTVTSKSTIASNCEFVTLNLGVFGARFNHVLKSCIISNQIVATSLVTDAITKLVIHDCINIGAGTPLDVSGLLSSVFAPGGYVSVKGNSPECYDDARIPTGAWAQSYIDIYIGVTGSSLTATYSLSGKAWALVLPNINMSAFGLSTSNMHIATTPLYYGSHASGSSLTIECNLVFSAIPKYTRVTGNLY